jgi:hypothetical protein
MGSVSFRIFALITKHLYRAILHSDGQLFLRPHLLCPVSRTCLVNSGKVTQMSLFKGGENEIFYFRCVLREP